MSMSMCLTAVTLGHIVVIGTLVSGTTATEFDGGLHRASVNVAPLSSVSSPPPPPPPPQQLRPIRVATPAPPTSPDGPLSLGFDLTFLSLTDHPTAVCNDGSPAAYYIHKGTDPTRWVVHMQGGWWCWDQYSCQVRWDHFANHTTEYRTLMSTKDLESLTQKHDTFNGEKNTGIMTEDPSNATKPGRCREFVLTGGSAGGMATISNADYVHGLLQSITPAVKYVAMPDSGYFLDVSPGQMCSLPDRYECECAAGTDPAMGEAGTWTQPGGHSWLGRGQTLAQQVQAMAILSEGVVDASCASHFGKYGVWRCYLGQYAAPFIKVTSLFLQNQIDEWQGFWNGFSNYTTDPAAYEYADWFRYTTQGTMRAAIATSPRLHIFSPNCYHHGLSYDNIFWQVTVNGWTSGGLLRALLDETHPAPPQLVLDECLGIPCSPQTVGHADCVTVPPPQ